MIILQHCTLSLHKLGSEVGAWQSIILLMVQSGEKDTCACIDFQYMYTTKLYSSPCTKFILAVCTIRVFLSKTL
jgi:hypothetical protein